MAESITRDELEGLIFHIKKKRDQATRNMNRESSNIDAGSIGVYRLGYTDGVNDFVLMLNRFLKAKNIQEQIPPDLTCPDKSQ